MGVGLQVRDFPLLSTPHIFFADCLLGLAPPAAFVRFFSATFWPATMLRIALWAGQNFLIAAQAASKWTERWMTKRLAIILKKEGLFYAIEKKTD
jgi:hypothetical protein